MFAKHLHRIGAVILVVFIFTHLSVHLFALAGPQAHINALKSVQWIYRNPFGEFVPGIGCPDADRRGLCALAAA